MKCATSALAASTAGAAHPLGRATVGQATSVRTMHACRHQTTATCLLRPVAGGWGDVHSDGAEKTESTRQGASLCVGTDMGGKKTEERWALGTKKREREAVGGRERPLSFAKAHSTDHTKQKKAPAKPGMRLNRAGPRVLVETGRCTHIDVPVRGQKADAWACAQMRERGGMRRHAFRYKEGEKTSCPLIRACRP